jgi:hypothetical protein
VALFGFALRRGGKVDRTWWMTLAPEQVPASKKQIAGAR